MRFATTISRYFGLRFLSTVLALFLGVMVLVGLIDYIEMLRRTAGQPDVSVFTVAQTSLFRIPQVTERLLPFCMLVSTMSCYLGLSRRLELVIARSAGMSAWQFLMPALAAAFAMGVIATTLYNPVAASLAERAKRLEAQMFGERPTGAFDRDGGFWVRQVSKGGQSVINAKSSREQGVQLVGVTVFNYGPKGEFRDHIDARTATLLAGVWRLEDARVFSVGVAPRDHKIFDLPTDLTPEQVRESFATPETVPFWSLPTYISLAERAGLGAAGYRLQYEKLLVRPLYFCTMVLMAAGFSLRFFRFGGVRNMVLAGVISGFLLYVLSKVTDDMAEAALLPPIVAAWLPVAIGGLGGIVALLYQEDG